MKRDMIWAVVVCVILNIILFCALARWLQNYHVKVIIVPAAVQADTAVATNTTGINETNLVPSGINTTNGISLKGKVQSGWGESK